MESSVTSRLVKRKDVGSCLSCSICCGMLNEATTLSVCLHTFCKSCISRKILEEDISSCPQCDAYLGGAPLDKLRMDNILQKIRAAIFPKNLYVKKVCNLPEVTDHIIQKATTPMSETKKEKNAGESMHFTESATVKELQLQNHLTSKQIGEIRPADHPNPFNELVTGTSYVSGQGADYKSCSTGFSPTPIWFSLISSNKKNGLPPLLQLPLRYLNTKNGNAPVHLIKKYLARKLNLSSENEVEITLLNQVIGDHCRLKDLLQLWLRTHSQAKRIGEVSITGKDGVMPLVYARKASFDN